MKKILINYAHPAKSRSTVNRSLIKTTNSLEGLTVNDLYANYPDFLIDVEREQALCEAHDIIIFQHPFYWYSTPAIMKEWLDLVLEHGWAYGSKGHQLEGKIFLQAISSGADAETYQPSGYNEFTYAELTTPYRATAKLCNMTWLPPFVVSGVHRGLAQDELQKHTDDYLKTLTALRDDQIDLVLAGQQETLNSDLNSVIKAGM
ncbi:NAD(P)H-dependent oxidoreductase [Cocleimonas flava]|uniref:Kef-type potassium/proton antiporter accessory protein (CPA2 family) n=1 Tax=Cocleimonas flava TaxID=634765 RepID=A0A4R1EP80_9GAMM|nr:NAD(P)H-dependent oxidoreductase [Cocleimonas flava]TCJ83087.1 Kef-type potassium/proton antiporter accessory protein (CPA2 family) [Cocleimonas flava]